MAIKTYYQKHWRDAAVIATLILVASSLIFIAYVIGQANRLSAQNKQHIDCIIKDLATPQKPGTSHKYISELSSQCNIKFTN